MHASLPPLSRERRITTALGNATACPRDLDPMIAAAAVETPSIVCHYVTQHYVWACRNLRLWGFQWEFTLNKTGVTKDDTQLDVYKPDGTFLRTQRVGNGVSILRCYYVPMRAYVLRMRAIQTMKRILLRIGATEKVQDWQRLTMMDLPRTPRMSGNPTAAANTGLAAGNKTSIAEVDTCREVFCFFFERTGTGTNTTGNMHMYIAPGTGADTVIINLQGLPRGLLAHPFAFIMVF
jgi:hypothetical protein